ncbi:MAG: ribonuclease P protein component [Alphaproteobacteria bacterium]|nr:ribonuclease P protein component [Alphaproteobacteria bacterium]
MVDCDRSDADGPTLGCLRDRWEFLRVAGARRKWAAKGLVLQAAPYDEKVRRRLEAASDPSDMRYGLTASKKVGNAVARNRARRRLRALAHEILPAAALPRHDYVLIARGSTPTRAFSDLRDDLLQALRRTKTLARHAHPKDGRGADSGPGRAEA